MRERVDDTQPRATGQTQTLGLSPTNKDVIRLILDISFKLHSYQIDLIYQTNPSLHMLTM